VVIANGEIYNYPELAPRMVAKGHQLKTKSDCEIILHLYEDYGLDFINHMVGMFAFALWDERAGILILARDRMGVKPLHYYQKKDTLFFGSELKALLSHPAVENKVDLVALYKYLSYEYVPSPLSIFEEIYKVEPGQMVIWKDGAVTTKQYWDLSIQEAEVWTMTESDYVDRMEAVFSAAVKRRLMGDVEIGVLLSGGVDSSIVANLAAKHYGQPMRAFTIVFDDASFNELSYAEVAAKEAGINLCHERLTDQMLINIFSNFGELLDEPFADPSFAPTYLLSRLAGREVKVALSGDGGDDIMAGYVTFQALKLVNLYKVLPMRIRAVINNLINRLPVSHRYLSLDFKLKQFMRGAGYSSEIMYFSWLGSFKENEKLAMFNGERAERLKRVNTYDDILRYLNQSTLNQDLERILYLTMKLYLQDGILVKVDRASMACSLEVRSPFLDHELVEFVNQLPSRLKLKGLTTKYLIKKMAERHLPAQIVKRKKKGFGMPIAQWLHGGMREMALDYLSRDRISREGFFDPDYVENLLKDHLELRENRYKQIWTLLMFELWLDHWMR
jgi:asparagine synthase (glutamine-hydrolysing)